MEAFTHVLCRAVLRGAGKNAYCVFTRALAGPITSKLEPISINEYA